MNSFDFVSFICKRVNLGNICKYFYGEVCFCDRGKYDYFVFGEFF